MSDDEFVAGYMDGYDLSAPEPSANRSNRYRHSFAIGRAEIEKREPPMSAEQAREAARTAEAKDQAA